MGFRDIGFFASSNLVEVPEPSEYSDFFDQIELTNHPDVIRRFELENKFGFDLLDYVPQFGYVVMTKRRENEKDATKPFYDVQIIDNKVTAERECGQSPLETEGYFIASRTVKDFAEAINLHFSALDYLKQ